MRPPAGIETLIRPIFSDWQLIRKPVAAEDRGVATIELHPVPLSASPARRLPQLLAGLLLYGVSMGLQIRSVLGLDPWDVLHDALSKRTGLSFGTITALTGVAGLLCWLPPRPRPRPRTAGNIIPIAAPGGAPPPA